MPVYGVDCAYDTFYMILSFDRVSVTFEGIPC